MNKIALRLAELVAMPTISYDSAANDMALDYVEHFFAEHGLYCTRQRFDGNDTLVASSRPDNAKRPTVLLAAHIDVVPGDESLFALRRRGNKLMGRGVFDMKFAIAGYMELVAELKSTIADYDFAIMIVTDEETGGGKGRYSTRLLVQAGYRPQVCFLPDATAPDWDVEKTAKGWWRFDLIAKGTSVHSARPWEGESASMKLIHALHELKEYFKHHGPLTDTLNIGDIQGEGGVYNRVPDHMAAKVEIRLANEDSIVHNKRLIEELCARHGLAYRTHTLVQPTHALLDSPLVDAYKNAVQAVTGKRPAEHISSGGSDGPFFTDAGVPCIISCPRGGGHHSDKEWIDQTSLDHFVPILKDFLNRTAKKLPTPVDTQASLM